MTHNVRLTAILVILLQYLRWQLDPALTQPAEIL
jgi:hypothetical protein